MTTTGHSTVRHKDDFYSTPEACTRAILPHLVLGESLFRRVLEPCAGTGAILKVLPSDWHVDWWEIDKERFKICKSLGRGMGFRGDLFVESCLGMLTAEGEAAFLFPLTWMATKGRAAHHRDHPSDVYVLSTRPGFAKSVKCKEKCGYEQLFPLGAELPKRCPRCGEKRSVVSNDSSEYAWFVYGRGRTGRWSTLDW